MKKSIVILFTFAVLTSAVSAQKMSVSLDVMPLVKGIDWGDDDKNNSLIALAPNFEYLFSAGFTLGGSVDLYIGQVSDVDFLYFGLTAQGRWYPSSQGMSGFFIGGGLGFNAFSLDGEFDKKKGGFMGLVISIEGGYKAMLNSKFFIEPSMAYVYAKESGKGIPTPSGWQAGLSAGMAF